jgi:hypothetical protein
MTVSCILRRMTGLELSEKMQIRLRPSEKRDLVRIAKHHERTPSEMVRRLIRKESRRVEAQQNRKAQDHGSEKGSEG